MRQFINLVENAMAQAAQAPAAEPQAAHPVSRQPSVADQQKDQQYRDILNLNLQRSRPNDWGYAVEFLVQDKVGYKWHNLCQYTSDRFNAAKAAFQAERKRHPDRWLRVVDASQGKIVQGMVYVPGWSLTEAEDEPKKSKTKEKEKLADIEIDDGTSKGELTRGRADANAPEVLPGRVRRDGGGIRSAGHNPDQSYQFLRGLEDRARAAGLDTEWPEGEGPQDDLDIPAIGNPEPVVTVDNLPAVISTAVTADDGTRPGPRFDPTWTPVSKLPNMMRSFIINRLGKALFGQFTNTNVEDILMIASPQTASDFELNVFAAWVKKNGVRDEDPEFDFSTLFPGYQPDVSVWKTKDFGVMFVQDHAGKYAYVWPGGRGVALDGTADIDLLMEDPLDEHEGREAWVSGMDARAEGRDRSDVPDSITSKEDAESFMSGWDFEDAHARTPEFAESAEPLAESAQIAREMAILAGVIPTGKPKKIESSIANEMAILAGIKR